MQTIAKIGLLGSRRAAAAGLMLLCGIGSVFCGEAETPGRDVWPEFRGGVQGIVGQVQAPVRWQADSGIAWRAPLAGQGQSSPVIWKGKVFATSLEGAMKEQLHIAAYDLGNGRKLWNQRFGSSFPEKDSDYISKAAPTPAVDSSLVYVLFESGDLHALTHDGRRKWHRSLAADFGKFEGNHGQGASPVLTEKAVIVLMDHKGQSFVAAFAKADGTLLWKTDRETSSAWSTPLLVSRGGRAEILTSASGLIAGYDPSDGALLWSYQGIEGNNVPSPAYADGALVAGSRTKGKCLRLNLPAPGAKEEPGVAWKSAEAASAFGSPLIYKGRVYIGNDAGVLFCHDFDSGKLLWDQRLSAAYWASPLVADERIYFFCNDGKTFVIRPADEWQMEVENVISPQPEGKMYGYGLADGTLVFRFSNELIGIREAEAEF